MQDLLPGSVLGAARDAVLDALAVLLPVGCAGCGRADRALCPDCRVACAVDPAVRPTTRHLLGDGTPVVSALRYDGAVRATILAFKENGRTDVARPLAAALAVAIEEAARAAEALTEPPTTPGEHPALVLCPVPSTRASSRKRGYRPADLLVRAAGFRPRQVLVAAAPSARQKLLGREERGRNLQGSMRARCPLGGRRFVLIDDVVTTGATLTEAARAVREAGGEVVACATLAFTPLLFGSHGTLAEATRDIHRPGGYGV
jgi:ComF family protein